MIAWVLGKRNKKTFKRLYDKVKHLNGCTFYTDGWDVFAKVLPCERHFVGKQHTTAVESNNSNTRHNIGRFKRKSKIVSKCENAVESSLKLWASFSEPLVFSLFQHLALSIYS
jgi:IS1 family transposase